MAVVSGGEVEKRVEKGKAPDFGLAMPHPEDQIQAVPCKD